MKIVKYDVWSLDVWGNEVDGFDVNDRCCVSRSLKFPTTHKIYNQGKPSEFSDDWPTNQQIIDTLKDAAIMSAIVKPEDVEIDGDPNYSLCIDDKNNGCPLWQLELTE